MLDTAIKHKTELQERFRYIWFNEKYSFWNCGNYHEEFEVAEDTWSKHQFVSLDSLGKIIGYIGYKIDRSNESAYALSIINFTDNHAVFGLDAGNAIKDIFEKFHFRKISFTVLQGNPVESTYDKLVKRYRGRIVGIKKDSVRLIDGKYYNEKLYEIFEKDYRLDNIG